MGLYIVYNPIHNKQKGNNAILNNKRNKLRHTR